MLGNEAMKFLKTLHKLDDIWKYHDDSEYTERQLTQFAERYHEHKLKLLGIADVVGRSEQLPCKHDYQPDTTCGVDITCCTKCGDVI